MDGLRERRLRRALVGTALLAAAWLLVGVGPARGQLREVRMSYMPIMGTEPVYAAQERGFFAENGLRVDLKRMFSGGVQFEALMARSLDVVGITALTTPFYLAQEQGIYAKLVHPMNWVGEHRGRRYGPQSFLAVRADSPIQRVGELRGKVIAIHGYGTVNHVALLEQLKREGIDPVREARIIEVSLLRHEAVVKSGEVAAAAMIEPFATVARKRGSIRTIAPNIEAVLPNMLVAASWVLPEYARRNPDVVRGLQRALAKAAEWIHAPANQDERFRILAKWTNLDLGLVREIGDAIEYYKPYSDGFTDWGALQEQIDLMVQQGQLKRRLEATQFDPKR
ncbi:MAG: ABC transporter substrate-binding protein [Deltaproteobacteria bacterium]|nr:ABC transporter substrate-binding protein [Deltaproteobacteria bacterium]MBI3079484.1 ABC transporter substrate-binding protein [Deltaproteobacteria bacterium]